MSSYGDSYLDTQARRLFVVDSDPDGANPNLQGAPNYSGMTPIVVLRNPSTSGQRAIIKEFLVHQQNTANGLVHVRAMLDRADTYVTYSGVSRVAYSPNGQVPITTVSAFEIYDEEPDLEDVGFVDSAGKTSAPKSVGFRSFKVGDGDTLGVPIGGGCVVEPGQICAFYLWSVSGATYVTGRYQLRVIREIIPT